MTTFNLQITKAQNGWTVTLVPLPDMGLSSPPPFLVLKDEDLAGAIAAEIVAGRLSGEITPKAQQSIRNQYIQAVAAREAGLQNSAVRPSVIAINSDPAVTIFADGQSLSGRAGGFFRRVLGIGKS